MQQPKKSLLFLIAAYAVLCVLVSARASIGIASAAQLRLRRGGHFDGWGFDLQTDASGEAARICTASFSVLSCFDAQTRELLWSQKTPYGSIDTNIVMSGGAVFYAGGGGAFTIYGLSAKTGHILWRKNHTSYSLASAARLLFADGYGSGVIALARGTGKEVWAFPGIGPGGQIGRIFAYGGKVFTSNYILNARTGKLLKLLHTSPRVFAGVSGRVFGANLRGRLEAWDVASGHVLWVAKAHSEMRAVALAANSDYVFAVFYRREPFLMHHGVLKAYAASNGRLVWRRPIASVEQKLGSDPIGADGAHVYLIEPSATAQGSRILALDARTGEPVWSLSTAETTYGPPIPTSKLLYVATGNTRLLAIWSRSGKVRWSLPFPK